MRTVVILLRWLRCVFLCLSLCSLLAAFSSCWWEPWQALCRSKINAQSSLEKKKTDRQVPKQQVMMWSRTCCTQQTPYQNTVTRHGHWHTDGVYDVECGQCPYLYLVAVSTMYTSQHPVVGVVVLDGTDLGVQGRSVAKLSNFQLRKSHWLSCRLPDRHWELVVVVCVWATRRGGGGIFSSNFV